MSLKSLIAAGLLGTTLMFSQVSFVSAQEEDHRRCEVIQQKLYQRVSVWQEAKDRRVARWEVIRSRIEKIIEKLRERGYNVQKLEEDAKTMEGHLDTVKKDYSDIIFKFGEARAKACGDRDVFRAILEDLRTLIGQGKSDWSEMVEFMRGTFIPDIKSYKEPN